MQEPKISNGESPDGYDIHADLNGWHGKICRMAPTGFHVKVSFRGTIIQWLYFEDQKEAYIKMVDFIKILGNAKEWELQELLNEDGVDRYAVYCHIQRS